MSSSGEQDLSKTQDVQASPSALPNKDPSHSSPSALNDESKVVEPPPSVDGSAHKVVSSAPSVYDNASKVVSSAPSVHDNATQVISSAPSVYDNASKVGRPVLNAPGSAPQVAHSLLHALKAHLPQLNLAQVLGSLQASPNPQPLSEDPTFDQVGALLSQNLQEFKENHAQNAAKILQNDDSATMDKQRLEGHGLSEHRENKTSLSPESYVTPRQTERTSMDHAERSTHNNTSDQGLSPFTSQ